MLRIWPFDSNPNVSQWVHTANCEKPTWQMRTVHSWASVLQDHHHFDSTPNNNAAATRKSCCFSLLQQQPLCLPQERMSPCSVGAANPPALSFSSSTRAEGQPGGVFVPTCKTSHQSWAHRLCVYKQASAHTDNDFQSEILLLSGHSFLKGKPHIFSNLTAVLVPPGSRMGMLHKWSETLCLDQTRLSLLRLPCSTLVMKTTKLEVSDLHI